MVIITIKIFDGMRLLTGEIFDGVRFLTAQSLNIDVNFYKMTVPKFLGNNFYLISYILREMVRNFYN